uniref:Class II aldolase/adducin N-terminal domain-containing protein n=1 Tax=Glossina pallidipes TaxID=7398 RepID=A0A1A9ZGU6_GLOPL
MPSIYADLPEEHPRNLIPALCQQFYNLGWVTGTGGGISIKYNNEIFIAPSGVQKERIMPEDLFVQNIKGEDIQLPPGYKNLTKSQCTPLFMLCYRHRNAGAVIHTHSQNAVMATLLWPGSEFRCTHLEMIKGIYDEELKRNLLYNEKLVVPIIENTPFEKDLSDSMYQTMMRYPRCTAILPYSANPPSIFKSLPESSKEPVSEYLGRDIKEHWRRELAAKIWQLLQTLKCL